MSSSSTLNFVLSDPNGAADRIEALEAALEQSDALGKYWQARAIATEEAISGTTLAAIAPEQDK
jgi:hypothetical protein